MSILIKGMKMPKDCYGCPFFTQVDYWNKDDEADILSKCKRTGEFTWESVNGYLPNCPLIEVPPHGDLIDRDALLNAIKKAGEDDSEIADVYEEDYAAVSDWLYTAPTVIEASE